jgi:eukaryotic-like serine/threonine-protein kinase
VAEAPRPRPPQLDDIADAPSERGDLFETPAIRILFRLAVTRASGLLVLSVGGIRKEIYFLEGVPEYVSSNVAGELFGAYLVSQKAISEGELDMALAMMPHYGGKLGDTLVGLGLMKPLDVFRHLTRQVRQKLVDVCSWQSGDYAWYDGRDNPREAFPLDIDPFEVIGAGAMSLSPEYFTRWLERAGDWRPRSVKHKDIVPEQFRIGGVAREVYNRLDGKKTVRALAERYTAEEHRLRFLRVVFLLLKTDLARDSRQAAAPGRAGGR